MLCAAVRAEAVARMAVGATLPIWACARRTTFLVSTVPMSTAATDSTSLRVDVERGLPRLCVPLPSRKETCVFTLKPVSHSVGDFLSMLRAEDAGIDRAVCRTVPDGHRIASTTSVQTLMQSEFDLVVNDKAFRVLPAPSNSAVALADAAADERLGDVRALVGQLYEALNVDEYYVDQEQKLVKEMESLKQELEPLEKKRAELAEKAERRANHLTWVGLGLMSVQFGVLARLTWWEYSWDIMEPVTYFVTYGTAMACYAYFVLTRQDYVLPEVRDRQFLFSFYKRAKREGYDVERYNAVRDGLTRVEQELSRLRDPLRPPLAPRAAHTAAPSTSLLAAQINVGSLKNILKGKLS